MNHYVIGVDFGTDSVRALVVDALDGREISESSEGYFRWSVGKYQDQSKLMFRQHPLDYIDAFIKCVQSALDKTDKEIRHGIAAISIVTTGSTVCPVDKDGIPLSLQDKYLENPDAMFHLWKDHTAILEAEEITKIFRSNSDGIDYTRYQGPYSSEWFWAKILHTIRKNPDIREDAYSWVEHCDWIPSLLVNQTKPETMYRCACAAGHKAYWHSEWGGLPSEDCLGMLDPYLVNVRRTYSAAPFPSSHCLGTLTSTWAELLGLSTNVIVGGSSFDAHAGAVGAGVNRSTMVITLGTSAVDMFVVSGEFSRKTKLSWAAGFAENSIIPGLIGLETGQSSFGDVYAWFKKLLLWPIESIILESEMIDSQQKTTIISEIEKKFFNELQKQAGSLIREDDSVALDWFNGRRYPYINEHVQSAIIGINMGTTAPDYYRALVLATAFGQKRILETLEQEDVKFENLIAIGGIARKSPYIMQTLSDVLGKPISVATTKQACARGAAIYAAVAAGIFTCIEDAQKIFCNEEMFSYIPNLKKAPIYSSLYDKYLKLSYYIDPTLLKS